MLALLLILITVGILIYILTYLNRRKSDETIEIQENNDGECCGAHAVCDKDTLLLSNDKIEYFEDEELDKLACKPASDYNSTEIALLSDVFYTLKEHEVAAWLRSLQLRKIELPDSLREEALLIVGERRYNS
jgi:hypothetical protein